jgi:hypothetical protein
MSKPSRRSLLTGAETGLDISTDLEQMTRRALDALAPDTRAAMETAVNRTVKRAKKDWPIGKERPDRNYHSIEKFRVGVALIEGEVVGIVQNTAPWSAVIRRKNAGPIFDIDAEQNKLKGLKRNKLVWKSKLVAQGEEQVGPLVDAILDDIDKFGI